MIMLEALEPRVLLSGLTVLLQGDVNKDGYVNDTDAVLISRMAVHLDPTSQLGDLSGDGRVNGFDACLAATLGEAKQPIAFQGRTLDYTIFDGRSYTVDGVTHVFVPNPADFGSTWALDMSNPSVALYGADGVPSLTAIHQGQLADCYLLVEIGGIALDYPSQIQSLINWNGIDLSVTWTTFQGVKLVVHTSTEMSNDWQVNNGEAYWEVIEKTYAYFRTVNILTQTSTNTLASIEYGGTDPLVQMEDGPVTQVSFYGLSNSKVLTLLENYLTQSRPILYFTSPAAPTMVQDHVYLVTGVDKTNGTVTCYNPWGFYDTRTIQDFLANAKYNVFFIGA